MISVDRIKEYVLANQKEAIQCLVEALQSPSPARNEKPMAETMLKWINRAGISVKTYEAQPNRPNIIAEWFGSKPGKRFIFNGHMDIFPPKPGNDSLYGPWSGRVVDGYVYGPGANDMKAGNCAALMAVLFLHRLQLDPVGSIVLNYVVDEQDASRYGAKYLIEQGLLKGDLGISMEPTSNNIVIGHYGVYNCQIVVHGDGGHAGILIAEEKYGSEDAIKKSIPVLNVLYKLREDLLEKSSTHPEGRNSILSVTQMEAGTQINLYAREALINIDRRFLPGETVESCEAEIKNALEKVKNNDMTFSYEMRSEFLPTMPILDIPKDGYMVSILDKVLMELFNRKSTYGYCEGATDAAFIYAAHGIDMPIIGPGTFSPLNADSHDDRASVKDYLEAIQIYMLTLIKTMFE